MSFTAPVSDQRLTLNAVVGIGELEGGPDAEMVDAVLEGAAALAEGEFAPLARIGDSVGARWDNGNVTMPAGYKAAWQAFVDGGWMTLAAPEEHGGQGLPHAMSAALMDNLNAANLGFALCPMLSMGAIEAIGRHGSDELKRDYLPKIVTGRMAGDDEPDRARGRKRCRSAENQGGAGQDSKWGDASWRIKGTKIFITYGEHDLSDQIIHLVLARTSGAPEGTRGISLFLVPKLLPDGTPNDVRCVSIEHKLGIHASPTCVMSYGDHDGAIGWLVGPETGGMAAMFTMMNNARLNVGLQGVGIAERATQRAVAYALERKQGLRNRLPVPIAEHPDVRRMLLRMRALTMGARALVYYAFGQVDRAARGDSGRRTSRRSADSARQGLGHRCRLRSGEPRHPGSRRHGLYRGNGRGPASARCADRSDL